MTRREGLVGWVFFTAFLVHFAFGVLRLDLGIQAAACTYPDTATRNPAMKVEVYTTRKGHIVERRLLGCTFYSYNGPRWGGSAD
jgi:hypothetical protein